MLFLESCVALAATLLCEHVALLLACSRSDLENLQR